MIGRKTWTRLLILSTWHIFNLTCICTRVHLHIITYPHATWPPPLSSTPTWPSSSPRPSHLSRSLSLPHPSGLFFTAKPSPHPTHQRHSSSPKPHQPKLPQPPRGPPFPNTATIQNPPWRELLRDKSTLETRVDVP